MSSRRSSRARGSRSASKEASEGFGEWYQSVRCGGRGGAFLERAVLEGFWEGVAFRLGLDGGEAALCQDLGQERPSWL